MLPQSAPQVKADICCFWVTRACAACCALCLSSPLMGVSMFLIPNFFKNWDFPVWEFDLTGGKIFPWRVLRQV